MENIFMKIIFSSEEEGGVAVPSLCFFSFSCSFKMADVCDKAVTCMAAASLFPGLARAASRAVAVVPMLDPRVRGYARSRLITPIPKGDDRNIPCQRKQGGK